MKDFSGSGGKVVKCNCLAITDRRGSSKCSNVYGVELCSGFRRIFGNHFVEKDPEIGLMLV